MDGQLGQGVKTFRITRRKQVGFGIAISGGASPIGDDWRRETYERYLIPSMTEEKERKSPIGGHIVDNSIYISDVVAGGPADAQCLKMEKPPVTPYITENLPFMTKK